MSMEVTFLVAVALAATLIVVVLALVLIIIYQRWRIGDQNVFIERFIRQQDRLSGFIRYTNSGIDPLCKPSLQNSLRIAYGEWK